MERYGALEKINSLIGADSYKKRMRELAAVIPQAKERGLNGTLFLRNYLFSIDDGCGLTTSVELLFDLINESGAAELDRVGLQFFDESFANRTSASYADKRSDYRLVLIDISSWIDKLDTPGFKSYLHSVRKNDETTIYIFRIPYVDDNTLKRVHNSIYDVMYIIDVRFDPLSESEIKEYASRVALESGFEFGPESDAELMKKIREERLDGRYYGFNTIRKVVGEIVFNKLLTNAKNEVSDNVIGASDFEELSSGEDSDPLDEFDLLVGMENVKRQISEIVSQIKYLHSRSGVEMPCIHMRFVGPPGTGKTTAARLVGKTLAACGVLRNGAFFEYTGRSLIGEHIGETAIKTGSICRAAYGSVLFIDEAYSLSFSEDDTRDFGREALSVLVAEMENHRSDFVVIMAGYQKEMETMMEANPGLESRMPYTIKFSSFTREQLFGIFMNMMRREFEFTDGLEAAAKDYFLSIPQSVINSRKFSNARFVRNLYERCQRKALVRCMENGYDVVISEDDFSAASSEGEFRLDPVSGTIGF